MKGDEKVFNHNINHERLMKLLGPPNMLMIDDSLSKKVYVPLCPIGSHVYKYLPAYNRVICYRITEITFSENDCQYDAECIENDTIIDYRSFNEADIGSLYYLTRGAATRNMAILTPDEAEIVKTITKTYCKDVLKFKYLSGSGEAYFIDINSKRRIALKKGLKHLASINEETKSKIDSLVSKK